MGLSNSDTGNERKTFVNIIGGRFAVKTKEGTLGAVERENKNGVKVWEILYTELSGTIRNIVCQKNEKIGAYEYVVELSEVGAVYTLSIPCDSKYGDAFATKIPNVDLSQEVRIVPFDFVSKKDDKKVVGLNFYQGYTPNEKKIEYYYSKENPNGMPFSDGQLDEDEWKIYQLKKRKFLRSEIEKLGEKFAGSKSTLPPPSNALMKPSKTFEENKSEVSNNSDDLPF